MQLTLYNPASSEKHREVACEVCKGNRLFCVKNSSKCPVFRRALSLVDIQKAVDKTSFYGPSPPGVFLGSFGYPNVLAGPLVPVVTEAEPELLDAPDRWLDKSMDQLIRYRIGLVRGKARMRVRDARNPDKTLSLVQEIVMSGKPTDTELLLTKKPHVTLNLMPRSAPHGPSGVIDRVSLTSNPNVPRPIEKIVSDTDLPATEGAYLLYREGILQQEITRIFSVGLLGSNRSRRLVPTEWSITAIDDILAQNLRRNVLGYSKLGEYKVFGSEGLGNNVQVLLLPSSWMYEALEGWLTGAKPEVYSDYEFTKGRKDYPVNIAGAYHAARLPILEYLDRVRKQAGALAFLEVNRDWVPLGVWRFRELARKAFENPSWEGGTLEEALHQIWGRMKIPAPHWTVASKILVHYRKQALLDSFAG